MANVRELQLAEIKRLFALLEILVKGSRAMKHQTLFTELEYFFRDLLNLVYNWQLENSNFIAGKNQDSFDLSDETNFIAVQVTVTTGAEKIRQTFEKFIGKHDKKYKQLFFVYPKHELQESRADFSKTLKGYSFDPKRHRLGLGEILQKIQNMRIDDQTAVLEFLQKEITPRTDPIHPSTVPEITGEIVDQWKHVTEPSEIALRTRFLAIRLAERLVTDREKHFIYIAYGTLRASQARDILENALKTEGVRLVLDGIHRGLVLLNQLPESDTQ